MAIKFEEEALRSTGVHGALVQGPIRRGGDFVVGKGLVPTTHLHRSLHGRPVHWNAVHAHDVHHDVHRVVPRQRLVHDQGRDRPAVIHGPRRGHVGVQRAAVARVDQVHLDAVGCIIAHDQAVSVIVRSVAPVHVQDWTGRRFLSVDREDRHHQEQKHQQGTPLHDWTLAGSLKRVGG